MSSTATVLSSVPVSRRAAEVIARAAAVVSVPKAAPPNSFELHAPLELMARAQLLRWVDATSSEAAIDRIEHLGAEYAAAGAPVDSPPEVPGAPNPARLAAALAAGEQPAVDAMAAAWLPQWGAAHAAGLLGEVVVPSLAAAGHVPIGLGLLLRDPSLPTGLLRAPLYALAARPDWRVTWHERFLDEGDATRLHGALRAAPQLGRPGSDFIHPLMSQAQQPGVADRLLGPVLADRFDVPAARRTITRAAAWSMLHDDPTQAPYGWSHALTMPQAVMTLAGAGVRARTALAVAATFLLGFRVAHGTVPLPVAIEPVHASATTVELASAASLHEDAHLVKYTLACIHAAQDDPQFAGLYLAAAAHLADWWRTHRPAR